MKNTKQKNMKTKKISPQPKKKLNNTTLYVIFYLIQQLNGVLGKTHLQKLLFLGDLLSMKKFKEQITPLQYRRHYYGPYSSEVQDYTRCLERKGFIEIKELPLDGSNKYVRFYSKKEVNVKPKILEKIGPEKTLLLDEVIHSFGNISLQEVIDIVYNLEIVKNTPPSSPLDFAKEIKENEEKEESIA